MSDHVIRGVLLDGQRRGKLITEVTGRIWLRIKLYWTMAAEAGFPMKRAADKAGVKIVTGDTKVVPKGKADKIFINTSGIGQVFPGINVSGHMAAPGDKIIISGTMTDHGITILSAREGLAFESDIKTDSAPLNTMVKSILNSGKAVHVLWDPTRGGVGTTLNKIAEQSSIGIRINEDALPVRNSVQGICELLGFAPLYLANEGKLIVFVSEKDADHVLEIIKQDTYGKVAAVIGEAIAEHPGRVRMNTRIGGEKIVDMLTW